MAFPHSVAKVYNGSVSNTKIEVTDNTNILIHSITLLNATAAEAYLQLFDADADDVTLASTTPNFHIGCDATSEIHCEFPKPIHFTTGFTIASTDARKGNSAAVQEVTITYQDRA